MIFLGLCAEEIQVPELRLQEQDLSRVVLSLPIEVNVPSVPIVEIKKQFNQTRRDFSTGAFLYASNLGYGGMFFLTKVFPFGSTLYFNYSRDYFRDRDCLNRDYDSLRASLRGKFYGARAELHKDFDYSGVRFKAYLKGKISSFNFRVTTEETFLHTSSWWTFRNYNPFEFSYVPSLRNSFIFRLFFGRQEGYPCSGWIYGGSVSSETYVVPGWSVKGHLSIIEDPLLEKSFFWSLLLVRTRVPHPFTLGYISDVGQAFTGTHLAPQIGYPLKSSIYWRVTPTVKFLKSSQLSIEIGYMIAQTDFHYDTLHHEFYKVKQDGFYSALEYMQRFHLLADNEFYVSMTFYPSNMYENFEVFKSFTYLKIGDFFRLSSRFSLFPEDIASLTEAQFNLKLSRNYSLSLKGSYPYPYWRGNSVSLQVSPSVSISFTGFF